jgi:hypothetical protein
MASLSIEPAHLGFDVQTLQSLADRILEDKGFSQQNMLIWLSGSWLESSSELQPSPFRLKPAELIRGHFFEPAIVVDMGDGIRPYLGRLFATLRRVMGLQYELFWIDTNGVAQSDGFLVPKILGFLKFFLVAPRTFWVSSIACHIVCRPASPKSLY